MIDKQFINNILKRFKNLLMRCPMRIPLRDLCPTDENPSDHRLPDRRQAPRLPMYGGSFAVLHGTEADSGGEVFAQILDISRQGIAFRFFAGAIEGPQVRRIDITLPSRGIKLHGLPVRVVNETADRTAGRHSNPDAKIRRMGMCFGGLPSGKARALDELIAHFACGRSV
jgi:hypothetical protein